MKHTELPWKIAKHCATLIEGESGRNVGTVGGVQSNAELTLFENEANAAYIVKACNLFPELVEALADILKSIEISEEWEDLTKWNAFKNARELLTKAKI